jgi:hypothetical protein
MHPRMVSVEYLTKKLECCHFFKDLYIVLHSLIMFRCHAGRNGLDTLTGGSGSSGMVEFVNVQDVEPLSIVPKPNSVVKPVGRLSMKLSLEP